MTLEDTLRSIVREEIRSAVEDLRRPAAEPAPSDERLTVADVGLRSHAAEPTVRKWIRSGRLKASKATGQYLVLPADLERFLAHEPEAVPGVAEQAAAILSSIGKKASRG